MDKKAVWNLARLLAGAGDADLEAILATWPDTPVKDGDLDGLQAWVEAHPEVAEALGKVDPAGDAPQAVQTPAPPTIELLDDAPVTMRRPLALFDGRAYAASWLHTKTTVTEGTDDDGNVITYDPPRVTTDEALFVVRDDGAVFSDAPALQAKPINKMGVDVLLPEIPRPHKLWSAMGVKAYHGGARPDPAGVFNQVADVVGHFLDFERSLGSQRQMAELVACFILGTWFLPAFKVIGYLWPNGDRGCGKTVLLYTVAQLAYLGHVALAGGSFASIRDLADYGATLAFDDAENIGDPRKEDPNKRALLLAGNRRGNTITIKEQAPDKTWRTRYIDTFSPRLFSAIRLPDAVLASRAIVIPLIRTPDRGRANAQVLDYEQWPHNRRDLIDDLWALAVANLAELEGHDKAVGQEASLTGRNLEPWRAILAVAHWLDRNGVAGLWQRIDALSVSYQKERPDLEFSDLTLLVIRALIECVEVDVQNNGHNPARRFELATNRVTNTAKEIAESEQVDIDPEYITSRRVGRSIAKLRLQKADSSKVRGWAVKISDLDRLAKSYAIPLPDELQMTTPLTTNVTNVTNVIDDDLLEGEL